MAWLSFQEFETFLLKAHSISALTKLPSSQQVRFEGIAAAAAATKFKMTDSKVRQISELSSTEIRSFFDSFDTVMTDCDGVLWRGTEAIGDAPKMIRYGWASPILV